jgi:hypothetical protein
MTGLNLLGATIALGLIASGTPPSPLRPGTPPPAPRSFAIVTMAFASGIGVLGAVIGLLTIELGLAFEPSAAALVVFPAVGGALVGLALIVRAAGVADPAVRTIGIAFIVGQAGLAIVIAVLSGVLREIGGPEPATWPFALLGTASGLAAIGIGITARRGLPVIAAADDTTARAVMSRQVSRCAPFEAIGFLASLAAVALVVIGAD